MVTKPQEQIHYNKNPLIVITGPTACGKTAVSLELSSILDIEIISADSRQIYKYLDIGTAKPNKDELKQVKHYFIDIIEPNDYYSAGLFGIQAKEIALNVLKKGKIPVVVGGSGLYIKALCEGLFMENMVNIDKKMKEKIREKFVNYSKEELYNELLQIDPESALKNNDKNPRRTQRALEFYYIFGYPISEAYKNQKCLNEFNIIYYGIYVERKKLYEIINARCEKMWLDGLVEETERILKMGYSPNLNSLNTVGYKEAIGYIKGYYNKSDAINLMKQNTRRYAKRQTTWFRKNEKIIWLEGDNKEIAKKIAFIKNY